MKKFIALFTLVAALTLPAGAQVTNQPPITNILSGPIVDAIDFVGQGSNWFAVPFGMVSTDNKQWGGGLALGYKLSDFVVPLMRIQGIEDVDKHSFNIWMPSLTVQLQAPIVLFGKVTAIPLLYGGAGIPISGAGSINGDPVGILGAGLALKLSKKWDLVGTYEHWTNFKANQILFGPLYKF